MNDRHRVDTGKKRQYQVIDGPVEENWLIYCQYRHVPSHQSMAAFPQAAVREDYLLKVLFTRHFSD